MPRMSYQVHMGGSLGQKKMKQELAEFNRNKDELRQAVERPAEERNYDQIWFRAYLVTKDIPSVGRIHQSQMSADGVLSKSKSISEREIRLRQEEEFAPMLNGEWGSWSQEDTRKLWEAQASRVEQGRLTDGNYLAPCLKEGYKTVAQEDREASIKAAMNKASQIAAHEQSMSMSL